MGTDVELNKYYKATDETRRFTWFQNPHWFDFSGDFITDSGTLTFDIPEEEWRGAHRLSAEPIRPFFTEDMVYLEKELGRFFDAVSERCTDNATIIILETDLDGFFDVDSKETDTTKARWASTEEEKQWKEQGNEVYELHVKNIDEEGAVIHERNHPIRNQSQQRITTMKKKCQYTSYYYSEGRLEHYTEESV